VKNKLDTRITHAQLTDHLPTGLSFVSAESDHDSVDYADNLVVAHLGNLDPGDEVKVTVVALVEPDGGESWELTNRSSLLFPLAPHSLPQPGRNDARLALAIQAEVFRPAGDEALASFGVTHFVTKGEPPAAGLFHPGTHGDGVAVTCRRVKTCLHLGDSKKVTSRLDLDIVGPLLTQKLAARLLKPDRVDAVVHQAHGIRLGVADVESRLD